MLKNILLLFILLNISFEQSGLNIEISGGEKSTKCPNETGTMEFSSEFTYSSQDELNSYFILNLIDKSNKKHFSICQISITKNSTSEEEPKSSEIESEQTSSPIEPLPSQNEPLPSQNEPLPSQNEPTPSQNGTEPSQTESISSQTVPSQNETQPEEKDEYDPDDEELKASLGNMRLKIEARLKNIFDNKEELKTFIQYGANIINYQIVSLSKKINIQNIQDKIQVALNNSIYKLFELVSGNLTEKINNFNFSEAKDTFNSSICSLKKKIVENVFDKQYLFKIVNISQIIDGVSYLLQEGKNKTGLNDKVVNIIDNIMTKFNYYTIYSLEYIEKKIKTNFNTTNIKEVIEQIKLNLGNNTILNNLKNISFNKINETLYNIPNIIQDKIVKKEPLIIFDKIVGYLNNTKLNNSIHKIKSSFEKLENIIRSGNETDMKEIFNKMLNLTKTQINSLNNTLLNKIIEQIKESNNTIFEKLKDNEIPELIQNITNNLNELKNNIKEKVQNISFDSIDKIILNYIDKINKANSIEITDKILNQINLYEKITNFFKNETEFLKKYRLNITEKLKDYIKNNDELNLLIEKIKNDSIRIKSDLSTPEIIKAMEELKNYRDKIKQNLNDIKTEEQNKLNQTLNDLIDKIIKFNYTQIIDNISYINTQYKEKWNELKQSINTTNISSIIPKIREMINNRMNSFNITKFSNIYYEGLSKIYNIQEKISSSINFTRLEDIKFSLSNISDIIKNITKLTMENLNQSNITSLLKDNLKDIFENVKNKTNNFYKNEISEIISKIKNTTIYTSLEPIINQTKTKGKELISKINKTEIIDEFNKILSSFKNITIFNNKTELMEKIKNKISEIDLANITTKLNESLTKIKSDIINNMNNKTKYDEKKSELQMFIKNNLNKIKNLFNYTEIIQKVNNSLANSTLGKQIYEKIYNYSNYLNNLKNNINISDYFNSTKIKEILSDIKEDLKEFPEKVKSNLDIINESFYNCENEYIMNTIFNLNNLEKDLRDTNNKLKTAKIGDIKGIATEINNILLQDLKNRTKNISENSNFIALIKELNTSFIKAKDEIVTQIKNNEELKPFLEKLNNTKNLLQNAFEKIKSLPIITSLKNRTNSTLEKIYDIKLSDIKEYSEKLKSRIIDEINNMTKNEKLSQRVKYIIDKYDIDNNKIQNVIDKIFNYTKINSNITSNITQFISIIEKVENYFGELKTQNTTEKYNESKEYFKQKIKDINTKENLNKINETIIEYFNDTLNLIKLLIKKYESLPDKNNKTQLRNRTITLIKEEINKLNITGQILENINPETKELLIKVSDKIISVKDRIELTYNMTDILKILKEKINITQTHIDDLREKIKGSNISEIVKNLTETTKIKFKESIKEGLKKILDSEKINNITNNEKLLKIIERLKNNKIIGSKFAQVVSNFTSFIQKLNTTVHSNDDSFYEEIKENIRNYYEKINLKNISEIIKGIYENGLNIQEYIKIYNDTKSLIIEINKTIDNFRNIFNNIKKTRLRFLSINKKEKKFPINKRRIDNTGNLICRLDEKFSEDETLTAESENINSFIIKSNINYNIMIKSSMNIKVDKDLKCENNFTQTISTNINYKNISSLRIDHTRKRFNFKMRARIIKTFKIPYFFYLMMRVRLIIRLKNLRNLRNLESLEEEVPSFCVLEDDTDKDNASFDCFGYNDNINENNTNSEISIGNFTSDYIELPDNIYIANEPEASETDTEEDTIGTNNNLYRVSKNSGLNGGAIAGIVIASIVVLAVVIGLVIYLKKNPGKPDHNPSSEETIKDLNAIN